MYKGKQIGVVMPAYNESGIVGEVIRGVPDFVDRVYVVDDCSTDGTFEEIRQTIEELEGASVEESQLAASDGGQPYDRFVPIRHKQNRGVGRAIKTGYFRAQEDGIDIVAVMAGDGQMDPDLLNEIIDPIARGVADYSKGNRLLNDSFCEGMSRWRLFGNSLLTLLTKISSGYWKMMDPQNGYTAISREAIMQLPMNDIYDGFGFANDLLVKLNVYEMEIADVSMPARYEDETSHINYSTFVPVLSWLLLKSFLWRLKTRYVVRDFHPLVLFYFFGTLMSATGTFLGGWSIWKKTTAGQPLFIFASLSLTIFMIGTMFILFAMLFDMQTNEGKEIRDYTLND